MTNTDLNNNSSKAPLLDSLYAKLDQNENEANDQYYLIYQTPEEIFNNYIVNQPIDNAMKFFQSLAKTQPNSVNLFWAKKLFRFLISYHQNNTNFESFELYDLRSSLVLSNFIDLYKEYLPTISSDEDTLSFQEINQYFEDYLKIDPQDDLDSYMDKSDIIDLHEDVVSLILSSFELNEDVKKILLNAQLESNNSYDDVKIFNIVKNIIFENTVTNEEAIQIRQQINNVQNNFGIFQETQDIFHQISHGLIFKDKNEFFAGIDHYIQFYLESIGQPINTPLSLDHKIALFCSNYFMEIQENNVIASVLFEYIFIHYDEEIFKELMHKYQIPSNIVINMHDSKNEKDYFFSLLEFAVFSNNFTVSDSLISQKILPAIFKETIINTENNLSALCDYKPYMDISLLNENQFIYLIKNRLITEDLEIVYLEKNNDFNVSNVNKVENNILFYLLYMQYTEAFLLLHETAKSYNPDFETKKLLSHDNTDLLVYYIKSFNNDEQIIFNNKILDIFLIEGYNNFSMPIGNNLITSLQRLDLLHIIAIVDHLQEIFETPPEIQIKESTVMTKEIVDNDHIKWFDKAKLEKHMLNSQKEKDSSNKDYIKQMLSNNNHIKQKLTIKDESFFSTLETQFPNFKEVIDFYKSQFRLQAISNKKHITPVLLLGEPGIGKTYFAQKLAEYLNTGYTFLDMASLTSNWIITGNNGSWKSAKQGKILEAMMKSSTASPVILLDELDKSRQGEHDPTMSLYQLLEEVNAKSFTDEFVDFQFDASNIIYIACANTLGNLSDPLQTRFKIINVPKPSPEQLDSIIQNIYKEAIQGSVLFKEELDKEILITLKGETLRSIKVMINDAVGSALLKYSTEEIVQLQKNNSIIELTLDNFKSPYKKQNMGFSRSSK